MELFELCEYVRFEFLDALLLSRIVRGQSLRLGEVDGNGNDGALVGLKVGGFAREEEAALPGLRIDESCACPAQDALNLADARHPFPIRMDPGEHRQADGEQSKQDSRGQQR